MLEHGNRYRTPESEYNSLLKFFIGFYAIPLVVFCALVPLVLLIGLPLVGGYRATFGILQMMGATPDRASDVAEVVMSVVGIPWIIWVFARVWAPMVYASLKVGALAISRKLTIAAARELMRTGVSYAASDLGRILSVLK